MRKPWTTSGGTQTSVPALAGHAQDREVGEQRDALGDLLAGRDVRLLGRAAAVGRRLLLVVDERFAVAQRAHVVGEAAPGRVEVQVAHVGVARVAEAVDDVRRHPRQRAGRHRQLPVLDAEPHGQLALQDVEEVRVVLVHVQVRALHPGAEARQRRVHRIAVGQDLHPAPWLVTDDLAGAGRNHSQAHGAQSSARKLWARATSGRSRSARRVGTTR